MVIFFIIRLRKRIRFVMPGRTLSEIQQLNRDYNRTKPQNDEENTNDTDSSADETEPWIAY